MTIIDKRRGFGAASDAAQQAAQRAIDANVPDHVKTGVRVSGVSFDASKATVPGTSGVTVTVPHQLNRAPSGWHLMRAVSPSGNDANFVEVASDANTITYKLNTALKTGIVTADFWLF